MELINGMGYAAIINTVTFPDSYHLAAHVQYSVVLPGGGPGSVPESGVDVYVPIAYGDIETVIYLNVIAYVKGNAQGLGFNLTSVVVVNGNVVL